MRLILLLLFLALVSCQKEEKKAEPIPQLQKAASVEPSAAPSLEDLTKEKDEECTTEEDIKKKLEKELQQAKAPSLQGGDGGCDPNAPETH